MKLEELKCVYDKRQSFWHKAIVREISSNNKELYSYETKVAVIKNGELRVLNEQSPTTRRHIKEFAKQHNIIY